MKGRSLEVRGAEGRHKLLKGLISPFIPSLFLSTTAQRITQSAESEPRDCFVAGQGDVNKKRGGLVSFLSFHSGDKYKQKGLLYVVHCPIKAHMIASNVHTIITHRLTHACRCTFTHKITPTFKWKTIDFTPWSFQKDFQSRCFSAKSLTAKSEENEEKTQLKLVLMEAVALHYSELSRRPKGCCPCFTDELLFTLSRALIWFDRFWRADLHRWPFPVSPP